MEAVVRAVPSCRRQRPLVPYRWCLCVCVPVRVAGWVLAGRPCGPWQGLRVGGDGRLGPCRRLGWSAERGYAGGEGGRPIPSRAAGAGRCRSRPAAVRLCHVRSSPPPACNTVYDNEAFSRGGPAGPAVPPVMAPTTRRRGVSARAVASCGCYGGRAWPRRTAACLRAAMCLIVPPASLYRAG